MIGTLRSRGVLRALLLVELTAVAPVGGDSLTRLISYYATAPFPPPSICNPHRVDYNIFVGYKDVGALVMRQHYCIYSPPAIEPKDTDKDWDQAGSNKKWRSMEGLLSTWFYRIRLFVVWFTSLLLMRLVNPYRILLESCPLLTKSVTAALIGATGDLLAQTIELNALDKRAHVTDGNSAATVSVPFNRCYDCRRVFAIGVEGLFISGPLMHCSYDILESLFPVNGAYQDGILSKSIAAVLQVVIDLLLMDSVFVFTLLVASAVVEGRTGEIPNELRTDYIPAVKVSWLSSGCFAPVQWLSFRYLPVQLRVLATNIQDIFWNAAVSYMAHRSRN